MEELLEDFLTQLETLQKSFKSRTSKPHHIFWAEAEESRLQESLSQCLKQNQSLQHEIDQLLSSSEQDSKSDSSHLKHEISNLSQTIQETSHEISAIDSEILEKDLIISELLAKLDLVSPPEASSIGLPSEWKYFEGKQIEYEIISPRFLNDSEDSLKDDNEVTVFSPSNKGKRNACKSLDIQVDKFFDSDEFEKKRGKASRPQAKAKTAAEEPKAIKHGDEGKRDLETRDLWNVENGKSKVLFEPRQKFFDDEMRAQGFENFDGNSGLDEGEEFEQEKQFYLLSGREMSGDEEVVEAKHTQGVIIEYMEEVPLDLVEDLIEKEKEMEMERGGYGERLDCARGAGLEESEKVGLQMPQESKWEEFELDEDLDKEPVVDQQPIVDQQPVVDQQIEIDQQPIVDQQPIIDLQSSDSHFVTQALSPANNSSLEYESNCLAHESPTNHYTSNHHLNHFNEENLKSQTVSLPIVEKASEEIKLDCSSLFKNPQNNGDHVSTLQTSSISPDDLAQEHISTTQDSLLTTTENSLEPKLELRENYEKNENKLNENIEDSKDKIEITQKKNIVEEKPPVKKFFKYQPKVIPKKLQLAKNQKDEFFDELL